jgi:hypothetical protein
MNGEMMKVPGIVLILIATLISAAGSLRAQTSLNVTTYVIRDDNAFKTREARDEWINNSSLSLAHRFTGKNFRVQGYYSADILSYANTGNLNNIAHTIGALGVFDRDEYSLSLAAGAKLHNYQELYSYYDVNRYDLSLNLEYSPDLRYFSRYGIRISRDQYREFTDLDNLTYRIEGKWQRFFQSRLSLTGRAGLGVKNYFNQSVIQFFGIEPFLRYREDPVKAALLSLSASAGKSLTDQLGLSLELGGQWFVGEPIQSYSNGLYYYTENDLSDDPYAYQSSYAMLQLSQQFAVGFLGKLGIRYEMKDYAGTPALDEVGELTGDTRLDYRREYSCMLSKKFTVPWRFPKSVHLFVNLMYRSNPSNDPYYDYEDKIGLIGLSFGI